MEKVRDKNVTCPICLKGAVNVFYDPETDDLQIMRACTNCKEDDFTAVSSRFIRKLVRA